MASEHSVTQWLHDLKEQRDEAAARGLYDRYAGKLLEMARKKMRAKGAKRRVTDEEDVVQSAFESFCRRAQEGKFPKLSDRENLWPLLLKITEGKVIDAIKWERRKKRGEGKVRGDSAFRGSGGEEEAVQEMTVAPEPTPEFAAQCAEELDRLLTSLDNGSLRTVAIRKLEGYTTDEIARELGCSPCAVKQKAAMIRKIWESEGR